MRIVWVLCLVCAVLCGACSDDAEPVRSTSSTSATDTTPDAGDVGIDEGNDTEDDAALACEDDALSPNTRAMPASLMEASELEGLVVCQNSDDWYTITLSQGQRLTVALSAEQNPNIASELISAQTGLAVGLVNVDPEDPNRRIFTYTPGTEEEILVHVVGSAPNGDEYRVEYEVVEPSDPCADSPEEPNETREDAASLDLETEISGLLCSQDRDWFVFSLPTGHTASVFLEFAHNQGAGDLDMRVIQVDNDNVTLLAEAESATDNERVFVDAVEENRTLALDIYGFRDAEAPYTLSVVTFGPTDTRSTVSGVVTYDDLAPTPEGLSSDPTEVALWGGVVEVVRQRDQAPVGRAITDETGAFTAEFPTHTDEEYAVRAVAAVSVGPWQGQTQDRTNAGAIYALSSPAQSAETLSASPQELHAQLDQGGIAGAFNIANTVADAFRFIQPFTDIEAPTLTVRWQAGEPFDCGSCYSDNQISLGGQVEDTDEFDDAIILHEFGHYFFDHFSTDSSPGGPHRGRQVSPRLAYGEGIAYFFSGVVLDDPLTVDTFIDGTWVIDLERATQDGEALPTLTGTEDGSLEGNLREEVISTILWDAYDEPSDDEPFDLVNIGIQGHMDLFLGPLSVQPSDDQGARGMDLADWLQAFSCTFPDQAESLPSVVEVRDFPWTPSEETACDQKGSALNPYRLTLSEKSISIHAKTPTHGPYTLDVAKVALQTRNARPEWTRVTCAQLPCLLPIQGDDAHSVLVRITSPTDTKAFTLSALTTRGRETLVGRTTRVLSHPTYNALRIYTAEKKP